MARLDDATGHVVVRQRLDPHPSSVSQARRLVTRALGDLGRDELADDAALAVSELVTNALVHAGTPIEVVVSQWEAEVVVEVLDDNPRLPSRRTHAELAGTGRGLNLVEQLTSAWGAQERPPGKSVWFLLGGHPAGEPGPTYAADGDAPRAQPQVLQVVLLHVPLLLHAAWQMQAESVLREYLLTRLADEDSVEEELETHAAIHETLVLLREHIPAPDLGDHPEELMAAAVEPLVSAERLVVPVPLASLPDFDRLEATLDLAVGLADAGALLTPPTQPEVRAFRRWLCREVREQRTGRAPEPWSGELESGQTPAAPVPEGDPWDPAAVSSSDAARLAAADTNRILAVSAAALRLLGYDSEDELVGRRLVDIIPDRFRQAHLAGLTLHLFAGRSPLLGKPVTVPALRRDGTEVPVLLLVESLSLPGGRHVFLADLGSPPPS